LLVDAQLDNNGIPLSGGMVYWYLAGTTTPTIVYSESSGSVANTNPVILNTRGEPVNPIWLPTGSTYKAVLNDSLGNLIRTIDNISGVNDTTTPVISEWVLYAGAATYISGTSFSVTGDATATFDNGRRVKATVSGTDRYGTVNGAPVYALGVTTVTLVLDSGVLDSSLATVYYGFLDPAHPSFDTTGVNTNTKAGIQSQTWVAFTTGGTSGTYTLTPNPAITAYAAGQRFNVTFNAASAATNTINVSALGAKSLKMYDSTGNKIASSFVLNQISDIIYDGTDFVMTAMSPNLGTPTSGVLTNCTGTNLAKAWCNFDGTATTPITPRSNKNISSVTKSSTGVYVLNITTMADANYAVVIGSNGTATVPSASTTVSKVEVTSQTTTAINMRSYTYLGSSNNSTAADTSIISVVVFGN